MTKMRHGTEGLLCICSVLEEWREALSSRDKLVALQNELEIARQMQQSILPSRARR